MCNNITEAFTNNIEIHKETDIIWDFGRHQPRLICNYVSISIAGTIKLINYQQQAFVGFWFNNLSDL